MTLLWSPRHRVRLAELLQGIELPDPDVDLD
jgi:hypothetical protein